MDVHNRPIYLRSTVLLVVFLLHGSLILVFLRAKPADRNHPASPELSTTVFFIDPLPLAPPPEPARIPHRPTQNLERHLPPAAPVSTPDTTNPAEDPQSAAPPHVDWYAEAQRSAAEIAHRDQPGRAAESSSSPPTSAPWDTRPLLESTGHGLKLRIPVEIPGDIIDHCFANMDLGHDQTGQWQRYQLMCALGKKPARGDLFNSLRKPPAPAQ